MIDRDHERFRLLAEAHRTETSWRRKLRWIAAIVEALTPDEADAWLVDLAIYLRWVGSGLLSCEEDGQHYRPSQHAEASRRIHHALCRLRTEQNYWLQRRLYPWLPSFDRAFTRAEPLTRIRELAHRNDIPASLKHELKHTLQNKLHRCAGPEDLRTSAGLLERFHHTPQGNLPASFLEQFELFHAELEEFFGARSLRHQLMGLGAEVGEQVQACIALVLPALHEDRNARSAEAVLTEVRLLWGLRVALAKAPIDLHSAVSLERERTDVRIEEHVFALLSQLHGELTIGCDEVRFKSSLWPAIGLGLRHLRAGCAGADDVGALIDEIESVASDETSDWSWLRRAAALERVNRLTAAHADAVIARFAERAQHLAAALGLSETIAAQFCETELRASLPFQLSKLVEVATPMVQQAADLAPWTVAVAGHVQGRLWQGVTLEQTLRERATEHAAGMHEPCVLVVEQATGDELLPPAVAGLWIGRSLPILSHLAVRAREQAVVLVLGQNAQVAAEVLERAGVSAGMWIEFQADEKSVVFAPAGQDVAVLGDLAAATTPPSALPVDCVIVNDTNPHPPILMLDRATRDLAGGKAEGLRRLQQVVLRLAHERAAETFQVSTLPTLVIPLGLAQQVMTAQPELALQHSALIARLAEACQAESAGMQLEALALHFAELWSQVPVPGQTLEAIKQLFGDQALAVRSSANLEDLEQSAGAGVYRSVLNVAPGEVAQAIRAVWGSLYERRGLQQLMDQPAVIPKARMAVVVQPMLRADLSWIMHTVDPLGAASAMAGHPTCALVEVAVGLGEVLASATLAGQPFRLLVDRQQRLGRWRAFASFAQAYRPLPDHRGLKAEAVDYRQVTLVYDQRYRQRLVQTLADIARVAQQELGAAQDIEGAVVGETVYLVQARPQQGLSKERGD